MPRIAIYGGSFDPIHWGHLVVAEQAREQCGVERVVFVPAAVPPHKRAGPRTSFEHRLAMVEHAIADHSAFAVSAIEGELPKPSYTFNTVEALAGGASELVLVVGADSVAQLPTWHRAEELFARVTLAIAPRPGATLPSGNVAPWLDRARLDRALLAAPLVDISSTDVRARARAGRSLRYLVPEAVRSYIARHGLYRAGMPHDSV